jgi:predicted nucleotidyltransferase
VLSELTDQREAIAQLCRRYGVARLAVFGSAATENFDPERSDIDFLVAFDPESVVSRFEAHFGLKEDLEALLGHPVDLVAPAALDNPYFARSVEQTRHELFAA